MQAATGCSRTVIGGSRTGQLDGGLSLTSAPSLEVPRLMSAPPPNSESPSAGQADQDAVGRVAGKCRLARRLGDPLKRNEWPAWARRDDQKIGTSPELHKISGKSPTSCFCGERTAPRPSSPRMPTSGLPIVLRRRPALRMSRLLRRHGRVARGVNASDPPSECGVPHSEHANDTTRPAM